MYNADNISNKSLLASF